MNLHTGNYLGEFDLYDGHTTDGGATWSWVRLTSTSKDELRPFLTNSSVNAMQALVWFAGTYSSYNNFTTTVQYRMLNPKGILCP